MPALFSKSLRYQARPGECNCNLWELEGYTWQGLENPDYHVRVDFVDGSAMTDCNIEGWEDWEDKTSYKCSRCHQTVDSERINFWYECAHLFRLSLPEATHGLLSEDEDKREICAHLLKERYQIDQGTGG